MFSRQRTMGSNLYPASGTAITALCDGTQSSAAISAPGLLLGDNLTMWDNPTKDYHGRSARGEVIITNMRREGYTGTLTSSGLKAGKIIQTIPPNVASTVAWTDYSMFLPLIVTGMPSDVKGDPRGYLKQPTLLNVDQAVTLAATKALAKVSSGPTQGLVVLGEMGKTLQTLKNPIAAITTYLRKKANRVSKTGRISGGPSFSQMSASQFLAIYYGILPFMGDIENILESALVTPTPLRETARGSSTVSNTGTWWNTYSGSSWRILVKTTFEEELTIRRGVLYDDGVNDLRQWGLRLSDVPAALLETTPYSFVLDWFTNLGSFVQAISPVARVSYLGAWESWSSKQTLRRVVVTTDVPEAFQATFQNMRPCTDMAEQIYTMSGRNMKSQYDGVGLTLRNNMNLAKTVAALSLIVQQLHK